MANLVEHKKAHFNFEILDTYECGIELLGSEVKSLRASHGTLESAHALVRGGEVFVVGMQIQPFQNEKVIQNYDPLRTRKLLLHKKEIKEIETKLQTKGLTVIPLAVYTAGRRLKIKIGIAKGKKLFDKRETIKKRDVERELRRTLKTRI